MVGKKNIKQQILESALKLAEESSWEDIRLSEIAADLEISLFEIQQHYSQKDDLVEAWFDLADQAMLQLSIDELAEMELKDRLHKIMFTWFDALSDHKTITRDMLWYKFEPLHIHLQINGLLRISRTVQWMRELAGLEDRYLQRIISEIGLSSIYLCTFIYWLNDTSKDQTRTHRFLERKLNCIESCCCNIKACCSRTQNPRESAA